MKIMTCEMCGGSNLIKKEGMYACANCGVKYAPEEAKKLLIEGPVEVFGQVQIDYSKQTENLLKIASRAFESGDFSTAQSLSLRVLEADPDSYEAIAISEISRMMLAPTTISAEPDFEIGISAIRDATSLARKGSSLNSESAEKILTWVILVAKILVATIEKLDTEAYALKKQGRSFFTPLFKGMVMGADALDIAEHANQLALLYYPVAMLITPEIVSLTKKGAQSKLTILTNVTNRFRKKSEIYIKASSEIEKLQ